MNLIEIVILLVLPASSIQVAKKVNEAVWPEGSWTLPTSLPEIEDNLIGPACKRQFIQYISELQDLQLWALQMYDATGKVGSGLLRGNSAQLGDYDECVSISEPQKDIVGKYCLASLFIEPRKSSSERVHNVLELVTAHKAFNGSLEDKHIKISPSFSEFLWGLCVPSSCSANEVKTVLSHTLQKYNSSESGLDIKLDLKPNSCKIRDANEALTVSLFIALFIFALLISTTVYATMSDSNIITQGFTISEYQTTESRGEQIVKSFSLYRTIPDLLNTTFSDDITCVHGIRFIFSMLIFLIHKTIFTYTVPAVNRTLIAEGLESSWTMVFRAFWGGIDAFVLISGLLTSYFSLKKLKSGQNLNILNMYIQRYIKFTPLFYMTVLSMNIANYLMEGPMTIHITSHFVEKCQSNWKSLLYISNVDSLNDLCYPPSHQLITDMQMYILAPFIILAMWKWRKISLYAMGLSIFGLTLYKGATIYFGNMLTVVHYGASNRKLIESADHLYINTIHRLTPYFFGLLLGYILQMRKKEDLRLSSEYLNLGSGLAVVCGYYSFFAISGASKKGFKPDAAISALYGMLQPILWGVAISWTIFTCHTGQAETLNKFLSWRGFIIFSKISYPLYMVQILIIFFWIGSISEPQRISTNFIFNMNEIASILAVTLLFTQLFLLPLRGIMAAIKQQPKSMKYKNKKEINEAVSETKFETEKFKQPETSEKRRKNIDVDILKLLADAAPNSETVLF